jgi:death-on-curing family protein
MNIFYLDIQNMDGIFDVIAQHYTNHEKIPDYKGEKEALKKLKGVLLGAQQDAYYPTLLEKAAHLIIQINKGHFFSNGNKRVALVTTLIFVFINDYAVRPLDKNTYRNILTNLFPKCTGYTDFDDFRPEEFGYYNLSIIIADSDKYVDSFDELKRRVNHFFDLTLAKS